MSRPGAQAFLLVLAAMVMAAPARAQVQDADTSKAIVIKTPKESKPRNVKFLGEVLSSNAQSITVRGRDNGLLVRTFTYGAELRDKMQQVLDRGGYQHGDKVEIESQPNSDVVLRIKGKPSKSL